MWTTYWLLLGHFDKQKLQIYLSSKENFLDATVAQFLVAGEVAEETKALVKPENLYMAVH